MNILRLFAAALLLFVWPPAAGNLISSLGKGKRPSFAAIVAEGAVCMLAVFEVLFLVVSNTGRGLSVLARTWLVVTILVFAGSAMAFVFRLQKRKVSRGENESEKKSEHGAKETGKETGIFAACIVIPMLISLTVLMAAVCISKLPAVSEQYRTAETAVVILRDGSFFGTDPLTGFWLADVTPDQRTEGLGAFYAVLMYLTGISGPRYLLGIVAAVWVILLALSVLYEAADRLLSLTKHYWVFCLVFCLCVLCVGGAYRNPFYDLIHVPYEGRTILSFLILPMIFLSMVSLAGNNMERSKEEKHGQTGFPIARAILCLTASFLAAGCTCGIGCGLFPAMCELLVLVLCLIGWNLQKRFTA